MGEGDQDGQGLGKHVAGIIALAVLLISAVAAYFFPEHFFEILHALTTLIIAYCAMRAVVLVDEFGKKKFNQGRHKEFEESASFKGVKASTYDTEATELTMTLTRLKQNGLSISQIIAYLEKIGESDKESDK